MLIVSMRGKLSLIEMNMIYSIIAILDIHFMDIKNKSQF